MQGHYVSGLQCSVIAWQQKKPLKDKKAQALQNDVDQAVRQSCKQAEHRLRPPPLLSL